MCTAKMILKKKSMVDNSSEQTVITISISELIRWIRCSVKNLFRKKTR